MEDSIKPLYLLSDSQLLFLQTIDKNCYLSRMKQEFENGHIKSIYIGASNKDKIEFYELFKAAMNNWEIFDCDMINSGFSKTDKENLENADLIFLSGGDTKSGWDIFKETGIKDIIIKKYHEGTFIIGVSAGAVQLGWQMLVNDKVTLSNTVVDMLKLAPFVIDVHQESNEWGNIKSLLKLSSNMKRGFGIPFGAGIIYHPDQTLEITGKPIHKFVLQGDVFKQTLLLPSNNPVSL